MIRLDFTKKDIQELRELQFQHPHHVVRRRAQVLILKSQKISHHKISEIIGISENTVLAYLEAYLIGGVNELKTLNFYKPQSRLKQFDVQVAKYFENTPPATINQACAEIKELTGVSIKHTQMRVYMKSIGVNYRKVGGIPAKVDIQAQQKFHDEQLQPRLQEAQNLTRTIFFVDAAHFVLGAFLGFLWSFTRVFIKTPSGRKRFNVLGALNAVTKELVTVTNDSYITAIQVCELLKKLDETTTTFPITVILDNARYQRCQAVMEFASKLNIELLFLPTYSPNLNLIERLWRLVKKECLYSKYYKDFSIFSSTITAFLATMHKTHKEKLESLFTLKFQLFTEKQIQLAA